MSIKRDTADLAPRGGVVLACTVGGHGLHGKHQLRQFQRRNRSDLASTYPLSYGLLLQIDTRGIATITDSFEEWNPFS